MSKTEACTSIFEKYQHSHPPFAWTEADPRLVLEKDDIVCEGELQEVDSSSGNIHSCQYFVATKDSLVRCAVTIAGVMRSLRRRKRPSRSSGCATLAWT